MAISCINKWPAVKLAVSRTPRARGRMNKLIVSMTIRIGTRGVGVPSGRRWPSAMVGWLSIPINTVVSHNGRANAIFRESCVVGVNVYGRRPKRLIVIKNNIKAVSNTAHLCPPRFMGCMSW